MPQGIKCKKTFSLAHTVLFFCAVPIYIWAMMVYNATNIFFVNGTQGVPMQRRQRKAGQYMKSHMDTLTQAALQSLAQAVEKSQAKLDPGMESAYRQGIRMHLAYLAESLLFSSPQLFFNALRWGKVYLPSISIPAGHIKMALGAIRDTLEKSLPSDCQDPPMDYLDTALAEMDHFSSELPSFLDAQHSLYKQSKQYLDFLLANQRMEASRLILDLVQQGTPIKDIYMEIFQPVQYELGRLWQMGAISVAQEHYCTASTQLIMSQLYPHIFQPHKNKGVFVGACISGELHEIGIRMLCDLLELEGWDTYYLGANVPAESIIDTIADKKAQVLGLSVTMTYHMQKAEQQIRAIRQNRQCRGVTIFVGGYVFHQSQDLWKTIGADAWGLDLSDSTDKINAVIGKGKA